MTLEDAAATAALNQTVKELVQEIVALRGEVHALNVQLDRHGFPTKEELDGTGEDHQPRR